MDRLVEMWRTGRQSVEWPTLGLIALNYLAFALLTLYHAQLPWWLLIPLAASVLTLYSSLQHEILHGHPTPWQWFNEALLFPSLTLWLPYTLYRDSHRQHHTPHYLTDPQHDPESYYLMPQHWAALPTWGQYYYQFYNTLAGRLLWGPVHNVTMLFLQEGRIILQGDARRLGIWAWHLITCIPVLYWVLAVCDMSFPAYLLLFVYPGISLSLLRSYLEHRAVSEPEHRSAIVESNRLFGLLFLNNNLHVVHHAHPGLVWYRIPAVWQAQRQQILQGNDHYYYRGYGEILRRHGLRAKESPRYPLDRSSVATP